MSDQLFVIPWTAACQASLSFSISQSLLKFMSMELVMLSNHLILCCSFLHLSSVFPSIREFSRESSLRIRWPSIAASASMNEYQWVFRVDFLYDSFYKFLDNFLAVNRLSTVFSSTIIQKHQFFGAQPSLWSNSHIHTWLLEKP